ncbi:DUF4091 domain-containing protein [bacterium]|nr:MAG: DUF4091 domain-containing protein [bacterium]
MKTKLLALLFLSASLQAQTVPFDLFCVSDVVKVFEDGYKLPPKVKNIDIFGIRGETLSAQAVIHGDADLGAVHVLPVTLVNLESHRSIPPAQIRYNFVRSVPMKVNTDISRGESLIRKAPGLFPDYLSEDRSIAVPKDKFQSVWLTIDIPKDAAPGKYTGTLTIETDKGSKFLDMQLTVYPLTMPAKSNLYTTNWYQMNKKYHDFQKPFDEQFFKLIEIYAKNMASHRQNVFRVELYSIAAELDREKSLHFDFTNFDRWVTIFEKTGAMSRIETGFIAEFETGDWEDTKIVLKEREVLDQVTGKSIKMKGDAFLPQFLPAFEKHLKEKGWLEKTLFHISDEPCNHNVLSWREASDFVHTYAPSVRRIDAIEGTYFDDRLEVWVPKLDELTNWWEIYKKRQAEGNELWYYMAMSTTTYPNRFIDSPLIETRLLHWLNYRFGITGYLHWGYNQWASDDPYTQLGLTQHGIGSDCLVYPKRDGILNSIRLEQERNSLSDYEYFWLLEQEMIQLKKEMGPTAFWMKPEQRGQEIASKVMKATTEFSRDPDVLYGAKREVLKEIFDLRKSPMLYVQSNPMANTRIVFGQILLEINGWTESGTEISINDKPVKVGTDGQFRNVISLDPNRTTLKVTAKKGTGMKTIVREFEVK